MWFLTILELLLLCRLSIKGPIGSIFGVAVEREQAASHYFAYCMLETMSMEIFASNGWSFSKRIAFM
jgi:hypothetical protein